MDKTDFQIVFDKVAEANESTEEWVILSEATQEELDEIAELQRLSKELASPDEVCFTTT